MLSYYYLPHRLSSPLSSLSLPSWWRRSGELLILLFSLFSLAFSWISLSTTSQPLLLLFSLQASPGVLVLMTLGVGELLDLEDNHEMRRKWLTPSPEKVWGRSSLGQNRQWWFYHQASTTAFTNATDVEAPWYKLFGCCIQQNPWTRKCCSFQA